MKNAISIILIPFFLSLFSATYVNSQCITPWCTTGNVITSGEWLGSDGTSTVPLELKTTETGANALPINFWTNGAQRMTILGNNGATNGFVGIGIATPQNLLHLHLLGNTPVFQQFTNGTTGGAATNGLRIGITNNGVAEIRQQENNAMVFYTNSLERLRISNNGFVGIGTATPAYTLQVNGTIAAKQILVETNAATKDLLALIAELQYEVEELKQKYRCLAETCFVTTETK